MARSYTFEEMTGSSSGSDMPVQAAPRKTSYTFEEIQGIEKPTKKKQKSFSNAVSGDLDTRTAQAMMSAIDFTAGKKSFPELALSAPATAARFVGDVAGEGLSRAIPQPVKDIAGKVADVTMQLPVPQNIANIGSGIAEDYGSFKKAAPRPAQAIEDLATIGTLGLGASATGSASKAIGTGLENVGEAALKSVPKLEKIKLADGVYTDLILPKMTNKNAHLRDVVEVGINKEKKVVPNKSDLEVIEELKKIKGVSPRAKSLRGNLNIIRFEKERAAEGLRSVLKDKKAPVAPLNAQYDKLEMRVKNMEGLTEERRKSLLEPIRMMKQNIARKSGDINLEELWKARQNLDTDIEIASGADLTPRVRKVYDEGVKELRDITNQYIDTYSPGTLESLKKQSALIRAEKAIAPKELKEPDTVGKRIAKKVKDNTLGGSLLEKAVLSPVSATALTAKGVGNITAKLTRNATLRKALGVTLSKTGQLMKGGKELSKKEIDQLSKSPVVKRFEEPKPPLKTKITK